MQEYDEDVEVKKNRRIRIIVAILIILILLCIYFIGFGKVTYAYPTLIPTGDVDIFDINAGSACSASCECKENEIPVFYETDYGDFDVTVYDDIDLINNQVNLRIFDKAAYEYDDKIYPGIYNSYNFIVRNNNDYNILYNFKASEYNIYNINMKYRLKVDGEYIIGDDYNWVTANELIIKNMSLSSETYHTYNLDWRWFDDDDESDTYAGENAEEHYKLNIQVFAFINGVN